MTEVGKNKLNHPSLGTAGGSALHAQMEGIFTEISDNLSARWHLYSSVANGSTVTFEHNFQVPLSDLRVHIYTTSGGVQTRLTDLTGWLIQATSGYAQSKIDVTVPSSNGPYTFYLYVSHEPMSDKLNIAGGTMTGPLVLSGPPSTALNPATKAYADTIEASKLSLSGGTMTGNINMGTGQITNLDTGNFPTQDHHVATKKYVDTVAQGLDPKYSVKAATTANITLSGTQTVDGIALSVGDRVLVKDQTTLSQNGIYVVASGSWTRATDMNDWAEVPGAFVFVEQGGQADKGYVCTADQGGVLGTTAINWTQFAGVGTYTADGQGLELTGTVFGLELDGSTLIKSADGLKLNPAGNAVVNTLQSGAVTLTSYEDFTAITTPANPSSGKLRAYAKSDNKLYTLNSSGIEQAVGSGGSIVLINKASHGFVAADVGCPVYINASGDYVRACADLASTAEVAGLINRIVDSSNFEVCLGGEVSSVGANASGAMTVGEMYFLSPTTPGALTSTEPTTVGHISKPIGIARTSSAIEFFNMRGITVGGVNARSQVILANNATTNTQNVSSYDAGKMTGWVYIDGTTKYRFYIEIQFSRNGANSDFNVSYQTSGDTPPSGFAVGYASNYVTITLPSVGGTGTLNYALNAPAVGTQFPLSIDASAVSSGTLASARLPVVTDGSEISAIGTSNQTITGAKTFSSLMTASSGILNKGLVGANTSTVIASGSGYVGEFKWDNYSGLSTAQTDTGNVWTIPAAGTLTVTLSQGVWLCGYSVTLQVAGVASYQSGNVAIFKDGTLIDSTISYAECEADKALTSCVSGFTVIAVTTGTPVLDLRTRARFASANGYARILGTQLNTGLTNSDAQSYIFAVRIA